MKNALRCPKCESEMIHCCSMEFHITKDEATLKDPQVYVDNLSLSEWQAIKDEIDSIVFALEYDQWLQTHRYYV